MASSLSNRYYELFGRKPVLFPVIHVQNTLQMLASAEVAVAAGCSGVFLTLMEGNSEEALKIWESVHTVHPDLWIGLNYLDITADRAARRLPASVAGLWTDNALISEESSSQTAAGRIKDQLARRKSVPLYFGGVAFKYQRAVRDPALAARHARDYMDVVVTSGRETGVPAELDKIRQMSRALEGHPLALASGVTSDNVSEYVECGVSAFLVATSITIIRPDGSEILDLIRVNELQQALAR